MSMTWSAGTTFSIERAGTFALGGAADAAGIAAVGAFLIADVAGVALSQPQLVSREMAEHYAALEAHNLALIKEAKANGLPVALPTPSPFSDQAWVNSLPTQSQIDQRTAFPESRDAPNPIPGTAPLEAPSVAAHGVRGEYDHRQNGTPGFARHEREIGDDFSDAKRYPYVNTYELKTEAGAQARTFLNNCDNDPNDSRKSFDTLKSVLKNIDPTPPGWDAHHIVEQSQTEKFGTEAIQNPNNIINIDSAVHRAITQEYNSAPGGGSDADKYAKAHPGEQISRVRDYVKFLSYSEQRQVGLNAIQRALENPRVQIPEADRARMERDIERLRNVGRETPSRDDPNGCPEPPYSRVQGILSRLSDAGSRSQLTMANKTPEQTIQWAELAKRIRDNISGPTESKLNIRIPSPINVLERGKSGSVTDLAPVLGRVVGVEGKYLMFEKINGERIGLDLINTLAASKNIAATYAFLQNAYEKGHPVQIAMTNAQDLSVMHVSALQLDQGRGQSRFDEYRGRQGSTILTKLKYEKMSLDELFAELCSIRIQEHALFQDGAPTRETNKWIRRGNEVADAINARGEAARPYYLRLLKSERPELRIVAALNVRDYAPDVAVPVLEELNHGKWGGTIGMNASMALDGMRRRGEIPMKP